MFTTGKTVLITGSTDGIGKQTAKTLAEQGAHVLVHGRNAANVQAVIKEIQFRVSTNEIGGVCG